MSNFDAVIAFSLRAEGGFVNDPQDPGGATNWGITLEGLSEWRGHRCTVTDIKGLSRDEAVAIYSARYWLPMGGPALPGGLDLVVFDFGINAGPGRSIPMLQRAVGAAPDGQLGPKTLALAQCSGAVLLSRISALSKAHEAYYHSLPGFSHFGRGWSARVDACDAAARGLAGGSNVVAAMPSLPKPRVAIPWTPLPDPATAALNEAQFASITQGE